MPDHNPAFLIDLLRVNNYACNTMRFYISLPKSLKPYFEAELERYRFEYAEDRLASAWKYLERAHIIGQRYPSAHTYVHWKMLWFGFRIKSLKEIVGQIPRLIFGGIKSFVGKVPIGNPGGANVPPLKRFPIEEDIREIFIKAGVDQP